MKRFLISLSNTVEHKPVWIIIIALLITLALIPGILLLKTDSSLSPLVSPSSPVHLDTQRYQAKFGGEPITIVLNGNLEDILAPANLRTIAKFEKDLASANACRIISPVTFLNHALQQAELARQNLQIKITQAVEEALEKTRQQPGFAFLNQDDQKNALEFARNQVLEQFRSAFKQLEISGEPSLENSTFINSVIFDREGNLNSTFASLIPDNTHALIIVTPDGPEDAGRSVQITRNIDAFFTENKLEKVSFSKIGFNLIADEISQSLKNNLLLLLGLALVVMVIVLFVLFRVRWRLLSLLMVGIGVLWTFGFMGYISIPITMATMAVLPVLIGLGIDYPIQFHNRYHEELEKCRSVGQAVASSFRKIAPAVALAVLATVTGFAALYFSSVPMIRDFGVILVVGVVLCFFIALFLLYSIVVMADRNVPVNKLIYHSRESNSRYERILSKVAKFSLKYPLGICIATLLLGIGGGIVDHWLPVNTDFQKLIPQNLTVLRETQKVNSLLGTGGQIKFMVEADDITSRSTLEQLNSFQEQQLKLFPELISASSPATLVNGSAAGQLPGQEQIDFILTSIPGPLVKQHISDDKKMGTLTFNIQNISLQEIQKLIKNIIQNNQDISSFKIVPVGLMAISVETIDSVIGSRLLMAGLCLLAIFIVLLLVYRRFMRALFIIVCIGIVIGWSSLTMYILGIPINPLTSVLGVITTAIGIEFMVLLTSRYNEELRNGISPRQAMVTAVVKMGKAIITTGITTMGGFGVLIASNFVLVRDFGIATVIGIFLCLVSTLIVLPSILVWWDEKIAVKKRVPAIS